MKDLPLFICQSKLEKWPVRWPITKWTNISRGSYKMKSLQTLPQRNEGGGGRPWKATASSSCLRNPHEKAGREKEESWQTTAVQLRSTSAAVFFWMVSLVHWRCILCDFQAELVTSQKGKTHWIFSPSRENNKFHKLQRLKQQNCFESLLYLFINFKFYDVEYKNVF